MRQPLLPVARRLRRDMTLPERLIWNRLKVRDEGVPVFRRQYPYGRYVFDFYCARLKLVIEIDGWGHNMGSNPERDSARDAYLMAHGFDLMRIPAGDVLAEPDEIADGILRYVRARLA